VEPKSDFVEVFLFKNLISVMSHEHVLDISYRKALRELVRKLHERATNTITGTTVSEVCIVKASISHRTWFCRCQGSLVGSQRRWWKDACRRRNGAEQETRKEGWEKREARWEREKEKSLSRGGKLELYSLLSIFRTSLASPRRNPALASS